MITDFSSVSVVSSAFMKEQVADLRYYNYNKN